MQWTGQTTDETIYSTQTRDGTRVFFSLFCTGNAHITCHYTNGAQLLAAGDSCRLPCRATATATECEASPHRRQPGGTALSH